MLSSNLTFLSGHCIYSGSFLRFAFVLSPAFCKTPNFCLLNLKYITVTGLKHRKEASTCPNSRCCTTLQSPNNAVCRCRSHLGKIMFFAFHFDSHFCSCDGFQADYCNRYIIWKTIFLFSCLCNQAEKVIEARWKKLSSVTCKVVFHIKSLS